MCTIKDKATRLFQDSHITKFVYVDDMFGNTSVSKERCKKYVRQNKDKVDFITHPNIWEEEFENWWNNSHDDECQVFCREVGLKPEDANDIKAKFKAIFPEDSDSFKTFFLSPDDFDTQKDDILQNLNEMNQAMILVDYNMLENYGRNGDQILESLISNENINCALLSGTFTQEDEMLKWGELQDKDRIFTVSKSRIESDDEDAILEGVRNTLWNRQISALKNKMKSIVEEARQSMGKKLDDIDPTTFHKIVLDRSAEEGCWEFETLMRIVHAYLGLGIKDKLLNNDYNVFQTMTSRLRKIKNDVKATKYYDKNVIKTISQEETYEKGDYINKTYSQITNGDIFQIGQDKKEYILLCQPCNLEIRADGKRSRNFEQFFIIPLREFNKADDKNEYIVKLHGVQGEDEGIKVAVFAEYKRISLSILDLVSFNPDGQSKINLSIEAENHPDKGIIQNNMIERYNFIFQKIKRYKDIYNLIQKSNLDEDEKRKISIDFSQPYEMGDSEIIPEPKLGESKNEIDFTIMRVRRYKEPYARDLLQRFMNYLSRSAFPMELYR